MSIYNHFRKEELPFVERALEMLTQVERKQSMRLTDFLDPRQYEIIQSLHTQVSDVAVHSFGGYEGAERKRVLITPSYIQPELADYQLTLIQIKGNQRFVQLEHRDVMGALLHIGLKREKFGDILLHDGECQAIVASEIVGFVNMQVTQIHRIPVQIKEVPFDQILSVERQLREKTVTVASPRVDAVVGEVCNLSRAKALVPIRAGRLKVNFKVVDDPSYQVKEGDMISLQGFGRFEVLEVTGPTRSGRLRMMVGVYTG
ncbi:RNA-binding protein [Brevibacillus dissolubilis]|uniref:YlmH family RNA-binding protein n=1 Tax=Brevibacillus dissolubilis TaxID=1844116 RepID=UPI0011168DBE|nr:YlmH/Sll1252 family protein [Brevibacillus dissolubilis]